MLKDTFQRFGRGTMQYKAIREAVFLSISLSYKENNMSHLKIAVAGAGYVGLSLAVLLAQQN